VLFFSSGVRAFPIKPEVLDNNMYVVAAMRAPYVVLASKLSVVCTVMKDDSRLLESLEPIVNGQMF
jgi:hypothetical protein